ncbi:MAG: 6-pyruvoyl-tetrahydropterin synthase-related protein [Methylococcales bacterium]|nr:6-pyruvoyl-tetrahydropterin synthase-related protein [Methylococcales bacterium]
MILTHTLAFLLLAGWLWPLLEMHALTIPNDGIYLSRHWQNFLLKTLWPVFVGGLTGGILYCVPVINRQWQAPQRQALALLLAALALSGTFWPGANRIGLADIRFFPYIELFAVITGSWLLGESLTIILTKLYPHTFLSANGVTLVIIGFMCYWLYHTVDITPQWSAWNHSGYEYKASWRQLSTLFPVLAGEPDSPRLLFEHAQVNKDLGSTRSLEALPMFLGRRPVLEGLYMESALLALAIYYLQSEVTKLPSLPLVRFPSASFDIASAAQHMSLLHSNEVLVQSSESKSAFEKSRLFQKTAESSPFTVYRLAHFDSQFIQLLPLKPRAINDPYWMEHAFSWFKHYPKIDNWPIYTQNEEPLDFYYTAILQPATIKLLTFEREKIVLTTDRPGFPHLVKMSFHPRWQFKGKGRIYLAAPGYMVVVPEVNPVELVYGATFIDRWGKAFSILALVVVIIQLVRKRLKSVTENRQSIAVGKGLLI